MSLLVSVCAVCAILTWPAGRSAAAVRARSARLIASSPPSEPGAGRWSWLTRWRSRARRGTERGQAAAPEWLPVFDQLAASLRVGLPPAEALRLAIRGAPPRVQHLVQGVLAAAQDGRQCAAAWRRAARAADRLELHLLARSWAISEQLGAPLADAVDSAARAARSQRELSSRLATATAGARTTATILSLLPVAGVGVALLMGIRPADLYGSPTALASLGAGLLLIVAGRVVVNGMVDRVAEPG